MFANMFVVFVKWTVYRIPPKWSCWVY